MKEVAQTVPPFPVAATEESMTAHSGLLLFGEFTLGQGLGSWLEQQMPTPGSGHAYTAFGHSFPLLQTLAGGDHLLGDLRMIHGDSVLRRLLPLARVPSTDATGDWLRRMGSGKGLASLSRVNQRMVARRLRQIGRKSHTLSGVRQGLWTGLRSMMPSNDFCRHCSTPIIIEINNCGQFQV